MSRIFYAQLFFWIIACKNIAPEKPLFLPEGFEATVFVDSISETVRHMAVNQNGDLFAKFKKPSDAGAIAAIRDTNGDGVA
ncbi:MAG: hypothetical protein VXZ22_04140, partial [Bacteroidota bacterium]|nr:hypothetical protein [Bacteroidota bacterium]